MAQRNFDFVETLGRKQRVVSGRFHPAATDATNVTGPGYSVAHVNGTGVYTITLRDKYARVKAVDASLVQATRSQDVLMDSCDPASAGTIVLSGYPRGAAAPGIVKEDITVAADTYITFVAVLDDQANN